MAFRLFIVAGEPSGDVIGSRLLASLKRLSPRPVELAGIGGCYMERQGLRSRFPMEEIAVMGIAELLPHLLRFSQRLNETVKAAIEFKPQAIVTIDSKGFSFRFLKKVKEAYGDHCPPCVHYVAPSFWAWKDGEAKLSNLTRIVDHLLCILPFEQEVCRGMGLAATFVGHPVLEDCFDLQHGSTKLWKIDDGQREQFRRELGVGEAAPLVTVLPGSRLQELRRLLPIYGSAMKELSRMVNDLSAVVPTVPSEPLTRLIQSSTKEWGVPVVTLPGASLEMKYRAFAASDVALATSGTAVMQLQVSRLPSVVAYRANLLTEWIIKRRTKLQYISLPNIMLDAPAIPEALFSSCSAHNVASLLRNVLENPSAGQEQASAAEAVLQILEPPTHERPSAIAARVILEALEKRGAAHPG